MWSAMVMVVYQRVTIINIILLSARPLASNLRPFGKLHIRSMLHHFIIMNLIGWGTVATLVIGYHTMIKWHKQGSQIIAILSDITPYSQHWSYYDSFNLLNGKQPHIFLSYYSMVQLFTSHIFPAEPSAHPLAPRERHRWPRRFHRLPGDAEPLPLRTDGAGAQRGRRRGRFQGDLTRK